MAPGMIIKSSAIGPRFPDQTQQGFVLRSAAHGKSHEPTPRSEQTAFNTVHEFEDLDAVLNPATYFDELDDLEQVTITQCHLKTLVGRPAFGEEISYVVPGAMGVDWLLDGVLSGVQEMQKRGFVLTASLSLSTTLHEEISSKPRAYSLAISSSSTLCHVH